MEPTECHALSSRTLGLLDTYHQSVDVAIGFIWNPLGVLHDVTVAAVYSDLRFTQESCLQGHGNSMQGREQCDCICQSKYRPVVLRGTKHSNQTS